ncbi:MAG: 4'-phosphopantetheinyl transferase superfamily protein [Oscillospiraceae bacterium]|nr:4'-phosphopantetheinyl transferase superfamily protein [Oscillospiraceae bacterium]
MIKLYLTDCSPLQNRDTYKKYYSVLPQIRKEKADRYLNVSDKCLSVGAWTLLNAAIGEKSGENVLFEENGKPYFENTPIKFNLSHSGNYALCAVSGGDIGCDIEKIKEVNMKVAHRFFFKEEIDLLDSLESEAQKTEMFFRLWTLKESFMKATGLGFRLGLSDFCVYFENGSPRVKQSVDGRNYYFKEYNIEKKYAAAVCSAAECDFPEKLNVIKL